MSKFHKITDKKLEEMYYERLRKMSGEERMKIGFELCNLEWKIAEEKIRNQFHNISEEELKEKLKQRLQLIYKKKEEETKKIIYLIKIYSKH